MLSSEHSTQKDRILQSPDVQQNLHKYLLSAITTNTVDSLTAESVSSIIDEDDPCEFREVSSQDLSIMAPVLKNTEEIRINPENTEIPSREVQALITLTESDRATYSGSLLSPASARVSGGVSSPTMYTSPTVCVSDYDIDEESENQQDMLSLMISSVQSLCIDLLSRTTNAKTRRSVGCEEEGLLSSLLRKINVLRSDSIIDCSKELILDSLSRIQQNLSQRDEDEFAKDLTMIIGLTTLLLPSDEIAEERIKAAEGRTPKTAPRLSVSPERNLFIPSTQ